MLRDHAFSFTYAVTEVPELYRYRSASHPPIGPRDARIRGFFATDPERMGMSFEEGDAVVLHDKHSDHDGDEGTITQVMETMFGDANYTVSFEDGQEAGISEEQLEAAE